MEFSQKLKIPLVRNYYVPRKVYDNDEKLFQMAENFRETSVENIRLIFHKIKNFHIIY